MQPTRTAAIGFRAKTAKAIVIAVDTNGSAYAFGGRWEISLWDPATPETGQPHHGLIESPWDEAQVAVKRIEKQIEAIAIREMTKIAAELRSNGLRPTSVGITGSPDRNLERIGNRHIRAHAAEGILFRRVLEVAAQEHDLKWRSFSDRELDQIAEKKFGSQTMKSTLSALGKAAGKPWRVDERLAAIAAWLALE